MKKLACLILSLLMLICTIGCNAKSSEMTLNDDILENDYFSIDVSGYENVRIGEEQTGDPYVLAVAIAPSSDGKAHQYIQINYQETKTPSHPPMAYVEMLVNSPAYPDCIGGEILSYEYHSDNPNDGVSFEVKYEMKDGSVYYERRSTHWNEDDSILYAFYFIEFDNDTKMDEIYTNAIESLTWK